MDAAVPHRLDGVSDLHQLARGGLLTILQVSCAMTSSTSRQEV
jgi:hypothetical protein